MSNLVGTLHLSVFLRRDLVWFCSIPEVDSFSTRPGTQFKTKGAVGMAFILFGTSFLFVNSHLTAHEENVRYILHYFLHFYFQGYRSRYNLIDGEHNK